MTEAGCRLPATSVPLGDLWYFEDGSRGVHYLRAKAFYYVSRQYGAQYRSAYCAALISDPILSSLVVGRVRVDVTLARGALRDLSLSPHLEA